MQFLALFLVFITDLAVHTRAGELRCLRPGATVLSLYKDSRYFPGRVDTLGEFIDITFDNGKQQSYSPYGNDVIVDDMPDVSELEGGSRVIARRPNSISFEPGFVNGSIEGLNDTYMVNYDNGDTIARTINDIRLATKPSNCMNENGIYIGCFENVLNNYLTNYYPVNPTDVATCNWACFARGFNFAGLQNGTWCFCGNHVNDSLKVDDNDCNMACRDSREDVCGGYKRMTVYWTGAEINNDSQTEDPETNDDESLSSSNMKETELSTISKFSLTEDETSGSTNNEQKANNDDCSDIYDSTQCNDWANNEMCIHDPDWMIKNCRKSCYACGYNGLDTTTDNKYTPTVLPENSQPVVNQPTQFSPTQSTMYQQPSQYQYPVNSQYYQAGYGQSYYSAAQPDNAVKKSGHAVANLASNAGYLGCFTDSPTNHDLEYLADIKPLSIRACLTKCKSMRFPYAGVQSSKLCYCGLHYGKYGQVAHEDCNAPCEGERSEMCGGIFKNSLYTTGFSSNSVGPQSPITRKTIPSRPTYGALRQRSVMVAPAATTTNYQTSQTSYQQTNAVNYNQPNTYNQQSSSYYRWQPNYSQTSYPQSNSVPVMPSSSAQTQAAISRPTSPTYDPKDSSSYGWRETYVKLRAQEQARSARFANKYKYGVKSTKLTRQHNRNFQSRHHEKSYKYPSREPIKNPPKIIQHSPMSNHRDKNRNSRYNSETKTAPSVTSHNHPHHHHVSRKKHFQLHKSSRQKPVAIHREVASANVHKTKFAKPGIFLRKKTSKDDSFLAFLPHEVTKDEGLLENVYNMLSLMLRKLRKRRKGSRSMKVLKEYLKIPEGGRKHEKSVAGPSIEQEKQPSEKITQTINEKTRKHRYSQFSPTLPPKSFKNVQHSSGRGQKQTSNLIQSKPLQSNQSSPSNVLLSGNRLPHNGNKLSLSNQGKEKGRTTNQSLSSVAPRKPAYVYRVIIRPESTSDVSVLDRFGNASSVDIPEAKLDSLKLATQSKYHSKTPPDSRQKESDFSKTPVGANRSTSYPDLSKVLHYRLESTNSKTTAGKPEDAPKSVTEPLKTVKLVDWNTPAVHQAKNNSNKRPKEPQASYDHQQSYHGRKITWNSKEKTGLKEKQVMKGKHDQKEDKTSHRSRSGGHSVEETKKKKKILKLDAPLVKEIRTNGGNEILVGKSDEHIISTIVQLLEAEKRKKQLGKRKKSHFRHFIKKSKVQNISGKNARSPRSKTANVTHISGKADDNLMEEEQDFLDRRGVRRT